MNTLTLLNYLFSCAKLDRDGWIDTTDKINLVLSICTIGLSVKKLGPAWAHEHAS